MKEKRQKRDEKAVKSVVKMKEYTSRKKKNGPVEDEKEYRKCTNKWESRRTFCNFF